MFVCGERISYLVDCIVVFSYAEPFVQACGQEMWPCAHCVVWHNAQFGFECVVCQKVFSPVFSSRTWHIQNLAFVLSRHMGTSPIPRAFVIGWTICDLFLSLETYLCTWVGLWFDYFNFLSDVLHLHNFVVCELIRHDRHMGFLVANMGLCGLPECVELGWVFPWEKINYCIQMYLTSIQHKCLELIHNP